MAFFALIANVLNFCVDDEALISMSLRETAFGAAFAVCDSRLFFGTCGLVPIFV